MNKIRLILTIVVVFVLANFSGFFIHAIWLRQDYMPIAQHYRAEGQEKMTFIVLAYLSFAIGSVLIYARGVENKPVLMQGVRFGLLIFLVLTIPSFFIAYAVQPVPAVLLSKQVLAELVDKILLGVVTAFVYGKGRLGSSPSALE
ncbi:MAG: hypothetical protein M3R68_11215 [Acidobacteriota bacterium]|nr:hypothetical protein [Acidobacteriota bacterium]